jgi:hypothetical protein
MLRAEFTDTVVMNDHDRIPACSHIGMRARIAADPHVAKVGKTWTR